MNLHASTVAIMYDFLVILTYKYLCTRNVQLIFQDYTLSTLVSTASACVLEGKNSVTYT